MLDNTKGILNRLITASMLVILLIACQKTPEPKTLNFQSTQQNQVQQ